MPLPVLSVAQMREWENATWASGQSQETVMRRAGAAVEEHARRLTNTGDRIVVLAGKGHNGGDARFAAEQLREREVALMDASEPAAALRQLTAALASAGTRSTLIIDGLFGIGLDRPLDGDWISLVEAVNRSGVPVLAVDVPSGLNADTGQPMGAAIRAAVTVTFGAPKQGLLRASAAEFVGRLEVAPDIGLVSCPFSTELGWTVARDFSGFPPGRRVDTHKGSYGHSVIFAGSVGYHGAAVLASRAAQRAQPGLVTVFTDSDVYVPVASQLQAVMVQPWDPDSLVPENTTAILAGPGLASPSLSAKEHKAVLLLWHSLPQPMVVDASALDWLLPDSHAPANALRVITPHPGEAARLLKTTITAVQADRMAAVRALSQRFGDCWVVLKGHQTLIGRGAGEVRVNSSGNPQLAQGGSGDVLAGFLAGLLAQPALQTDPLRTLSFGVWEHGRAADRLQTSGNPWTVEDLVDALGTRC